MSALTTTGRGEAMLERKILRAILWAVFGIMLSVFIASALTAHDEAGYGNRVGMLPYLLALLIGLAISAPTKAD